MTQTRRVFLKSYVLTTTAIAAAGLSPFGRGLAAESLPADRRAAFLAAVRDGDLATVVRLLDGDPSLATAADADGLTAFALAHLHAHRDVGDLLVARGYRPDVHESALAGDWQRFAELTSEDPAAVHRDHPIGGTAMFVAALGGAGSDIWRVYAATGEPDLVPAGRGVSPLQAALRHPHLPTAEVTAAMLLGNAADPNPAASACEPPLHLAARRGSAVLVEMLIRLGARVAARSERGVTAREAALEEGRRDAARLLERHQEIPRTHSSSRRAFDAEGRSYAAPDLSGIPVLERSGFVGTAHFDRDPLVKALAVRPQLAHSIATTGEGAVEAGAHTGRREIVDLLLEHGAPYSLPTAVMRGDAARVERLLDQDPLRIHERGPHDFALLWYPVLGRCDVSMLALLLERGAKVEEQHYLGTTALHFAARVGAVEMAELLLDHGADIDRTGRKFDASGQTPLECALERDQHDFASFLMQKGARPPEGRG